MADLRDLIERVEKLDEPDRFTDEMIWEAVGGWPAPEYRSVDYMRVFGTPLTASLDAAIALCERVLPADQNADHEKSEIRLQFGDFGCNAVVSRDTFSGERDFFASGPTPAIALCLATLRALAKEGR